METMKIAVAKLIQVDNVLYLDVWETEKPKEDYSDDISHYIYQGALSEWESSFKRFPVKEEFVNNFKIIIRHEIAKSKNISNIFVTTESQAYIKGLEKGIFIPVANIQLKNFFTDNKNTEAGMIQGSYKYYAILTKPTNNKPSYDELELKIADLEAKLKSTEEEYNFTNRKSNLKP